MALNDIVFVRGEGGLGRPLPGQDYISGLIFYTSALPSGFSSNNRIRKIFSVEDAEAAGILDDYSDATAATGSYLVTAAGTNGDVITIKVTELDGTVVELASYTKAAAQANVGAVASAIAAAINARTFLTGYSATVNTATVTIIAPKKWGIFLNSGAPISVALSDGATIAGTLTQFSGGVASRLAVYHYHISEFFRLQPQGVLYVGFFDVPGSYTFSEIVTMQQFAQGEIRQMGIYKDANAFAAANLTAIQTQVELLDPLHMPVSAVLLGSDISAVSDLSTLANLSTLTAYKASAVIGQDGAGQGYFLFKTFGKSITTLGATLGAIALAKVSENIGWVGKFDMSNGVELETLAFANGTSYTSVANALLETLDNYRYIFLRKYVGRAGSFHNDSNTAVAESSDYAYIENNRTIDKAIRGVYSSVLPNLAGPLLLNANGTLADTTVASLRSDARVNLDQMVRDVDLSSYGVTINPAQNVAATSKVVIAVQLVPVGVGRTIQVNIGFTASI